MGTRTVLALLIAASACGKSGANEGAEEARKQAEKEQKEKVESGGVAKTIKPPVPGGAKLDCNKVLTAELMKQALGEKEDVTIVEAKAEKKEPDAAASCSVVRGGKRMSTKEQEAKLKKEPRLGVLPGDEICNISTFCSTIEDPERFHKRCMDMKEKIDDSLGFESCILVVAQGADDVNRHKFYDDDTKCIIQVRGGPSNVDNDLIGKCAKAAHDLIGPDQIKVDATMPNPAPEAPAGATGSSK